MIYQLLEGSAFVSRRARAYLQGERHSSVLSRSRVEFVALVLDKLKEYKFKDEVEHMANVFDKQN